MKVLLSIGLCLLSAVSALNIKAVRFNVHSPREPEPRYERFDPVEGIQRITLLHDEFLRMTFTVFDSFLGQNAKPHQAFLRFYDPETDEEGIQPVKISAQAKGKYDLNMSKLPISFPPTTNKTLTVSLILGSFTLEPRVVPLFYLAAPPSTTVPPNPEEAQFHPQPEITHTFRPDQVHPPKIISLLFVPLALAPWAVLLGALSRLPISLQPSIATAPFLGLLAAMEGLLLYYWIDLKLGQVLAYGAILGLITAAAGNRALSSL